MKERKHKFVVKDGILLMYIEMAHMDHKQGTTREKRRRRNQFF